MSGTAVVRGAACTLLVGTLVGLVGCSDPGPVEPDPVGAAVWSGGISGVLTGTDPTCRFVTARGGWGGVCDPHSVSFPSSGIFEATVDWSAAGALAAFLKDEERGTHIELACCSSPLTLRAPVVAGRRYRLELAYVSRPSDYPNVSPVAYEVATRLLAPTPADVGALSMILFADAARTQWMPKGVVEVTSGPFAGRRSTFDSVTGTHVLGGLPWGYMMVRVSADGFGPIGLEVPVGVSVPREVSLVRSVPLEGATNSLFGMLWGAEAWGTPTNPHEGIKIEILDGPQAGLFTMADDDMGFYEFEGLVAGVVRVRASGSGNIPLTQTVTVAGQTVADFRW